MRSGLYGMTNGNVRVLFVGGLSASSCVVFSGGLIVLAGSGLACFISAK